MTKGILRDAKVIVPKQFDFYVIFVVYFLNNTVFKPFQTLRPWTKQFLSVFAILFSVEMD